MPKKSSLKVVRNKKFKDTAIQIDGKSFVKCTFENSTIVYSGGEYSFKDLKVLGTWRFQCTGSVAVYGTVEMLRLLGALNPEFAISWAGSNTAPKQ